jgi:hypothetical protein
MRMSFGRARQVADAVLYEGYVLYPYRASARKNQFRWQFGVLAPCSWSEAGGCEPWWMQTECLIAADGATRLLGKVRFLQVQRRTVTKAVETAEGLSYRPVESLELDGRCWTPWDEAVEREIDFNELIAPAESSCLICREFPAGHESELLTTSRGRPAGCIVREQWPLVVALRIGSVPVREIHGLTKLQIRIENITPWADLGAGRDAVIGSSLAGVHTFLEVSNGKFVSLLDPPEWARPAAQSCENVRTWPVLVGEPGERTVLLSSPIILYDYPQIAPESPGDLFDSTEIDELLTLRTMTLTEAEKREARATDPRAAAVIERTDAMPPEMLERLHGAVRYLRAATGNAPANEAQPPWWNPSADMAVSPDTDSVEVAGVTVSKGSRVLLRPGQRRADAQDMFLAGKTARVEAVFLDVENRSYVAVTVEDDLAADLHGQYGRFFYFYPDEIEPLEARR